MGTRQILLYPTVLPTMIFNFVYALISYPNVLHSNISPNISKDHTFFVFCVFMLLVFANANQMITCPPNQHCVLNCTNTETPCSSRTINGTRSLSLSIYCAGDSSCEYSTILCPASVCNVECNGAYSCSDAIIHSNRSSNLNLHCNRHRACFLSTIFGPQSSVHIDCSADRSCVSSTFYLNTTSNASIQCHHTHSTDNDNACSTNSFHVNNASYAYFEFDADSVYGHEGGMSNVIYGMHIDHTLSIQCSGFKCARDLTVYCPIDAECIFITDENEFIASSLDIVQFFIPNYSYSNLKIHCTSSLGICSSIDQRIIRCIDTDETSVIAFDSIDNQWYCFLNENHCCPYNLIKNKTSNPIHCHDADCIINCSAISCAFMTINASLSTSLTVYCDTDSACQGSHILCPNHRCDILCTRHYSCQYMFVESESLNSLNIDCISASYECQYITVNTHMTYGANIRIACGNEGSSRSCLWSNFTFQADTDSSNVQVDIGCVGAYACQYSSWYMVQMNLVSLECVSRNSCELSIIDATTSSQITILCHGKQACYNNDIRCPSHSIRSCAIHCSDYAKSCRYLGITSVDNYLNRYLNIECPVNPVSNYVCSDIEVHCTYDGQLNAHSLMTYDELNGVLQCPNTICCPWKSSDSPTSDPSVEPTIEPTLFPHDITMDPTINPTVEPTLFPTYIPTADPSTDPTINPLYIPTARATTYPTYDVEQSSLYPTKHPTFVPSGRPNYGPYVFPTVDPVATHSIKPTGSKRPTVSPTSNVNVLWITSTPNGVQTKDNAQVFTYDIRDKPEPIYLVLAVILLFNVILLICILRYNLNKSKHSLYVDDQKYVPVILYCVQIFDLYSDVILSVQLYAYHMHSSMEHGVNESRTNALYILFVASVIFIVVPYIANFCSSIFIILNISNNKMIHSFAKEYFRNHGVLYITGVLLGGGSFGALQVLNSNLMGIRHLHCGLSTLQLQQFVSHKLCCSTLLQNIPNFLIQLCFIVELNVVTHTVILSNVTTLFNMLLTVCISVIVYIARTSRDQQEVPFTMKVSWTPRKNDKEEQKIECVHTEDPYQKFGNRMKLSLALSVLYNAMDFEVLSSHRDPRKRNHAKIYGVVKLDRVSHNKQKQIETFLYGKKALTAAVINAFGFEPYFTDKYDFAISVERNAVDDRSAFISKEMKMYLPKIWEGIQRDTIGIRDEVLNQLEAEIQALNDEGYDDEVHTFSTYHDVRDPINMEMEMKKNLSAHFTD